MVTRRSIESGATICPRHGQGHGRAHAQDQGPRRRQAGQRPRSPRSWPGATSRSTRTDAGPPGRDARYARLHPPRRVPPRGRRPAVHRGVGAILAVDALPGPFSASNGIVGGVATVDIRAPRARTFTSAVADQAAPQEAASEGRAAVRLHGRSGARRSPTSRPAAFEQTVSPGRCGLHGHPRRPTLARAALRAAMPDLSTGVEGHARRRSTRSTGRHCAAK